MVLYCVLLSTRVIASMYFVLRCDFRALFLRALFRRAPFLRAVRAQEQGGADKLRRNKARVNKAQVSITRCQMAACLKSAMKMIHVNWHVRFSSAALRAAGKIYGIKNILYFCLL